MAITAKFAADFSDFDKGVKTAETTMLSFEQQADRVGGRLMDLGAKGSAATPRMGSLTSELQKFDSLLGTMGVHLSGPIRAIGELGELAGKSATQVGFLGSAGAAAAALAGVQIGRFIADLTGSDKLIADLVNNLRGVSDASERAGAKADVLALASKNAGRTITDFNEAVKINKQAADDLALAWGRSVNPLRESNIELANWQREIREVRKRGDYPALTADINAQALSVQELSTKYGMHTDALEYLKRKLTETTKEQNAMTEANKRAQVEQEKVAKSVRDYYNFVGEREIEHAATAQAAVEKEAAALRAFYNEMGVLAMNAWKPEPIIDWVEKVEEAIPALDAVPSAASAADATVKSLGSAAQQAASSFFSMSAELYNAIRAAQQWDALAGADKGIYANTIGGIGGSSASTRYMGAANARPSVSININGSVLGNKDEIARVVGDAVTSNYRSGGNRIPV